MCRAECVVRRVVNAVRYFFFTIGLIFGVLALGFLGAVAVLWAVHIMYAMLTSVNPGIIAAFIFGVFFVAYLYDVLRKKNSAGGSQRKLRRI
jgi:riboflavin transporter FmnP